MHHTLCYINTINKSSQQYSNPSQCEEYSTKYYQSHRTPLCYGHASWSYVRGHEERKNQITPTYICLVSWLCDEGGWWVALHHILWGEKARPFLFVLPFMAMWKSRTEGRTDKSPFWGGGLGPMHLRIWMRTHCSMATNGLFPCAYLANRQVMCSYENWQLVTNEPVEFEK